MTHEFSIVLIPDYEEGGFTALVPSLPGCVSEGPTMELAIFNAREAIARYLERLESQGLPIPEERLKPRIATVRMSPAP
jgi:predicted RNase H-like HicB family nuclease